MLRNETLFLLSLLSMDVMDLLDELLFHLGLSNLKSVYLVLIIGDLLLIFNELGFHLFELD
jgi:hypothetical protein